MSKVPERPQWDDPEYRQAYADAAVAQGIGWQIRINRMNRKLTLPALAAIAHISEKRLDDIEQNNIAVEDLCFGELLRISHALDVVLGLNLITYQELHDKTHHLSMRDLTVSPYEE